MAYDKKFYELYGKYLKESSVRTSHDHIFHLFWRFTQGEVSCVDLGCGLGEYRDYGWHKQYVGVDVNNIGQIPNFVQANYHHVDKLAQKLPFEPNAFVSLFSIECCHSAKEKYAFYEKIFTKMPSVQYGLVGGFFYERKRRQETVREAGGLVSYQTIEDPSHHISKTFSELRLHIPTPSKMFGSDVIEVWKILTRR